MIDRKIDRKINKNIDIFENSQIDIFLDNSTDRKKSIIIKDRQIAIFKER